MAVQVVVLTFVLKCPGFFQAALAKTVEEREELPSTSRFRGQAESLPRLNGWKTDLKAQLQGGPPEVLRSLILRRPSRRMDRLYGSAWASAQAEANAAGKTCREVKIDREAQACAGITEIQG